MTAITRSTFKSIASDRHLHRDVELKKVFDVDDETKRAIGMLDLEEETEEVGDGFHGTVCRVAADVVNNYRAW
jgi:hypothetical protein